MYPLAILFTMSNAALYAAESECRCFLKIKLRTRAKMLHKGSMRYFWFIVTFSLQFSVKQRFFLLIILSLVPPFPFQSHFRFTVPLLALSLGETSFCHWYMDKVQSCKVTPGGPGPDSASAEEGWRGIKTEVGRNKTISMQQLKSRAELCARDGALYEQDFGHLNTKIKWRSTKRKLNLLWW